jgi:hypothetical protein
MRILTLTKALQFYVSCGGVSGASGAGAGGGRRTGAGAGGRGQADGGRGRRGRGKEKAPGGMPGAVSGAGELRRRGQGLSSP